MFKSFKEAGLKIKARAIPPREIIYGAQHLNLNRRLRSWRIGRDPICQNEKIPLRFNVAI
jgi:hypothetical protein